MLSRVRSRLGKAHRISAGKAAWFNQPKVGCQGVGSVPGSPISKSNNPGNSQKTGNLLGRRRSPRSTGTDRELKCADRRGPQATYRRQFEASCRQDLSALLGIEQTDRQDRRHGAGANCALGSTTDADATGLFHSLPVRLYHCLSLSGSLQLCGGESQQQIPGKFKSLLDK
jgi:hypothetical protein